MAKVERVERSCEYNEYSTTSAHAGKTFETKRQLDCSDDPAFLKIKSGRDTHTRLTGHATAIVRYTAPDKQEHQAWVKISSGVREFYSLSNGQQIYVRIDPTDPAIAYL